MKTIFSVYVDTETGICEIEEKGALPVKVKLSCDSLESTAYEVGEALSDYIQGFESEVV